ncbi:RHS repeat-associated core domain-containing protein [Streptomyces badius]
MHNGEAVAVRNGNAIAYLINDHQGTAMTAIAVGTLALTRRKQLPFGGLRSGQSTVFGNRGFVGGTNDPTGLTHLGAREYDPVLGRFLSVDPIIDFRDPAQMNAYSYAHNSPLTKSDPTGLRPDGPVGGNSYNDERWASGRGMTAGYTKKSSKWVWKQTPKKDVDSVRYYGNYRASPSTFMIPRIPKRVPGYKVYYPKKYQNGPDVAGAVKREAAKLKKLAVDSVSTKGEKRTRGVCAGLSGGVVALGSAGACFMWSKDAKGERKYGLSFSAGVGLFDGGLAGDGSYVESNADDLDQLAGYGIDKSVSAHYFGGVTAAHEAAVNTDRTAVRNFRNEPVWATSYGGGPGVGAGLGGGLNHTWMFKLN